MRSPRQMSNWIPLTEKEKEQKWMEFANARMENFWKPKYDLLRDREIITIASLEFNGGKCTRCDNHWRKIEFNNQFRKGIYFLPDCHCHVKCPCCKEYLYQEFITNILKIDWACPCCGFVLLIGSMNRYNKSFEVYYDKQKVKPEKNPQKAEQEKQEQEERKKDKKKYYKRKY